MFVQETLCSDSVAYLQHPTVDSKIPTISHKGKWSEMAGWEAARGVAMKAQVASGSWQTQHVLQMHSSGGESPPEAKKIFGQWLRCVLHQILDLASSRSQTSRYIVLHVHQCASMFINVLHIPQHFHDPFSARVGIRSLVVDRSQLPGFQGWWNSLPSNCHCTICMPLWRLYLWPLESEACLTKRGNMVWIVALELVKLFVFCAKCCESLPWLRHPPCKSHIPSRVKWQWEQQMIRICLDSQRFFVWSIWKGIILE